MVTEIRLINLYRADLYCFVSALESDPFFLFGAPETANCYVKRESSRGC